MYKRTKISQYSNLEKRLCILAISLVKFCSILPHGSWQDFEQEIKLFVPKEFAFKENLQYLQRSPNECMYDIKDDKIYRILSIEQENH